MRRNWISRAAQNRLLHPAELIFFGKGNPSLRETQLTGKHLFTGQKAMITSQLRATMEVFPRKPLNHMRPHEI